MREFEKTYTFSRRYLEVIGEVKGRRERTLVRRKTGREKGQECACVQMGRDTRRNLRAENA